MDIFRKRLFSIVLVTLLPLTTVFASVVTLDFSSGTFSKQATWSPGINLYEQDGFNVKTANAQDTFSIPTFTALNWYDGLTEIIVASGIGTFDLNNLNVTTKAYAGLTFSSSKGDIVTVGSITGIVNFSGAGWENINYFKISKTQNFDIFSSIDNITLTTVAAPEAGTLVLLALGLFGLSITRIKVN